VNFWAGLLRAAVRSRERRFGAALCALRCDVNLSLVDLSLVDLSFADLSFADLSFALAMNTSLVNRPNPTCERDQAVERARPGAGAAGRLGRALARPNTLPALLDVGSREELDPTRRYLLFAACGFFWLAMSRVGGPAPVQRTAIARRRRA
jgi:hypothetical protein